MENDRDTSLAKLEMSHRFPPRFANGPDGASCAPLSSVASQDGAFCGTAAMDATVFEALCAKLPADVERPQPGSKRGLRLLGAAERLRKLLSTMETAKTTAENMGDERDVALELSRDELREAAAPALEGFKALLMDALEKAKKTKAFDAVDAVELLGGGSRVAVAQAVVADVFGVTVFGAKLDDASLAHGAAQGRTRLIQRRFNVAGFEATPERKASTL